MSVIVKGMRMPDTCEECQVSCEVGSDLHCQVTDDGNKWGWKKSENGFESRPDWCPLRPLPEKHGRLIDGDALHALYESRWHDLQVLNWDENPHAEDIQTGVNWCINTLHDDLPTIVEAEG